MIVRLPDDAAGEVSVKLIDAVAVDLESTASQADREAAAWAVASVAARLSADKVADPCVKAAEVLLASLARGEAYRTLSELARPLAEVMSRLPAEKIGELARAEMAKLTHARNWISYFGQLVKTASQFPPATASRLSDQLVDVGVLYLSKAMTSIEKDEFSGLLVELVGLLPAGRQADLLAAVVGQPQDYRGEKLAVAIAALVPQLPEEQATALLLTAASRLGQHPPEQRNKVLSAVAERLPAGRAEEVFRATGDAYLTALDKANTPYAQARLGRAVAEVATRLPADRAEKVSDRAAARLTLVLGRTEGDESRLDLALALGAVAVRSSADEAAKGLSLVADVIVVTLSKLQGSSQRLSAEQLAAVIARLPAGEATRVMKQTAAILDAQLKSPAKHLAPGAAAAVAALCGHLPAGGEPLCEAAVRILQAQLAESHSARSARGLVRDLLALAGRLPADRATAIRVQVVAAAVPVLRAALSVTLVQSSPGEVLQLARDLVAIAD